MSPAYSGKAGVYTITATGIVQKQSPNNYSPVTYQPGTLYVDPKGGNSKNVKPSLDCVEPLINDPNGYTYVAHYSANNPNATTIIVALGDNNKITLNDWVCPSTAYNFPSWYNSLGYEIQWGQPFVECDHLQWKRTDDRDDQQRQLYLWKMSCTVTQRASDVQESPSLVKAGVYPNPAHNKATLFVGTDDVSVKDIRVIRSLMAEFSLSISRTHRHKRWNWILRH